MNLKCLKDKIHVRAVAICIPLSETHKHWGAETVQYRMEIISNNGNRTEIKIKTFSILQHQITITQYKKEFPFPVLFPPVTPKNVLAEWLSVYNVPQFHCAGRCGFAKQLH